MLEINGINVFVAGNHLYFWYSLYFQKLFVYYNITSDDQEMKLIKCRHVQEKLIIKFPIFLNMLPAK